MPAKKLHYSTIFFLILKLDKYTKFETGTKIKKYKSYDNVDFVQIPKLLLRVPVSAMMYKQQKDFLNNEGKNSSAFSK